MLPSTASYDQYPGLENVSLYRKGGFHPVNIDDVFHNRYRVINKLGNGVYGTVWLVEDLSLKRFAALKVLKAGASSEIDVIRRLRAHQELQVSESNDGAEYVMKVFDDFEVEGPNGTHQCIVTEILGPCLASDLDEVYASEQFPFGVEQFPYDVAKKIIAQLARGVAYLHKCGVVHADLHQGNILLYHPKLEHLSLEELERYFGKPQACSVVREDNTPISPTESVHLPQNFVFAPEPQPLLHLCLTSSEPVHVKICDFGEAFLYAVDGKGNDIPQHDAKRKFCIPRVHAAPEIIFDELAPGPPMDIWALAVLMHMILTPGWPIFSSYLGLEKEIIRAMVFRLGKLPQRWWTQWAERGEYFDENGVFLSEGTVKRLELVRLANPNEVSDEYLRAFEYMVSKMVSYEAEDRISADEVVRLAELMSSM